jgi:hypothetical protein
VQGIERANEPGENYMVDDADEQKHEYPWFKKTARILKHPLAAALLTFIFTGIGAALINDYLNRVSKTRDLELAATQRAAESVKTVTDLLFERGFRAQMIVSAIKRNADLEEIKDRKKAYDAIYVRYNSTIQSNLFRVREMFRTTEYTNFERFLEEPIRDLLVAQDDCVTSAYDNAVSSDQSKRALATENLSHCPKRGRGVEMDKIWTAIQECEYTYTDALFRIVERQSKEISVSDLEKSIVAACKFPQLK